MSAKDKLIQAFSRGADDSIDRDIQIVKDQGHVDTGAGINSFRYEIRLTATGASIKFYGLDYMKDQSTGLTPSEINYDYSQLYAWAARRKPGSTDDELNAFLYNTIKIWENTGMPTEGSKAYSSTGVRTGWIDLGTQYIDSQFENLYDITPFAEEVLDDALQGILVAA